MKREQLRFGKGFHVAIVNARAQAATMVLEPGDKEGGPTNRHRGADQWMFVMSGTGIARVNGRSIPLRAGTLILIEHGDKHEIKNIGHGLLKTLNIYAPPAYTKSGAELAAAKP